MKKLLFTFCIFYVLLSTCAGQYQVLTHDDSLHYREHIKYGQPDSDSLLIRNGMVVNYNVPYRTPNWVAFHVKPDYLSTPARKGKFEAFRPDPSVSNPVEPDEIESGIDTLVLSNYRQ
jgi:DNA/RNA endonuclease G (NUC1)